MLKLYEDMLGHLTFKRNFAWSRWGDGEMSCLLGHEGANCDNHIYFKDLGARLKETLLRNAPYHKGLQRKAMRDMGLEIGAFI